MNASRKTVSRLSHRQIERRALAISLVSVLVTAFSVAASCISTYYAYKTVTDQRAFAFDVACGPALGTRPDVVKPLMAGPIDVPAFDVNGDSRLAKRSAVAACSVYNLSKEPVPRLSFIVVVSDGKQQWVKNVIMEGFFPESSRVVWLENAGAAGTITAEIGHIVRYVDPLDHASHLSSIPATLATLRLTVSTRSKSARS